MCRYDAASKSFVMNFICTGYEAKGYQHWFEKRLRTGHFGGGGAAGAFSS